MTPALPDEPFPADTGDPVTRVGVIHVAGTVPTPATDQLAAEEPLAILITHGPARDRSRTTLSITLRTPGHDAELATGFLFAEGVVGHREQILAVEPGQDGNIIRVDLHPEVVVDLGRLDRRGYVTSSCGVCGKTALDAIEAVCEGPQPGGTPVPASVIHTLPDRLREAQPGFARTGGLHAAGLFDGEGNLLAVREDVGRHNAVDKLVGSEFLAGRVPLHRRLMLVSGRAGFELVQKAAAAGVPVFAAVGAPSGLAVRLARELGVTLLGFVRDGRFNIYTGAERIVV